MRKLITYCNFFFTGGSKKTEREEITYIECMKSQFAVLFLVLSSSFCCSQKKDSSSLFKATENYLRFNYDNDFFNATDRYYTQGISVTLTHSFIRHSPFSKTLLKLNRNALNYYSLQLAQDCFTPRSIRHNEVFAGERPYAATFFITHSLAALDPVKKNSLQSQLDLGVLGPCATCEDEQKAIHKALNNIQPLGWEHQVANDYILNYRVKFEKGIVETRTFEFMIAAAARLGTLYTDAAVGINFRFGRLSPYFRSLGLEKNPGERKFKIYTTFRANARVIGYNATLQGGLLNSRSEYVIPSGQVSRLVFDGLASVVIAWKSFSVEFSRTYITPEFRGGVDHGWGKCFFSLSF
jgi:lipid A 3-O-deacylase